MIRHRRDAAFTIVHEREAESRFASSHYVSANVARVQRVVRHRCWILLVSPRVTPPCRPKLRFHRVSVQLCGTCRVSNLNSPDQLQNRGSQLGRHVRPTLDNRKKLRIASNCTHHCTQATGIVRILRVLRSCACPLGGASDPFATLNTEKNKRLNRRRRQSRHT